MRHHDDNNDCIYLKRSNEAMADCENKHTPQHAQEYGSTNTNRKQRASKLKHDLKQKVSLGPQMK